MPKARTASKPKARKPATINHWTLPPEEFCKDIWEEIERGQGLVPLVGAGLSAESGIPVGEELNRYLTLCIAKALGLHGLRQGDFRPKVTEERDTPNRWHPFHGVWPLMEGNWVQDAEAAKDCLIDVAVNLRVIDDKDDKMETQHSGPLTQYQDVCRQAYGTLTDWRLALQFLARIRPSSTETSSTPRSTLDTHRFSVRVRLEKFPELAPIYQDVLDPYLQDKMPADPKPLTQAQAKTLHRLKHDVRQMISHTDEQIREQADLAKKLTAEVKCRPPVILGQADRHVIDSFFNHVVGDKSPNMGHRMLIHLIRSIRARVILTVNFDDLLEQAAHETKLGIGVLNVHHDAGLPPSRLLGDKPTVVKVHGAHYGLRADFTLDEAPSETDCRHFRSYLVSSSLDERTFSERNKPLRERAINHLLVVGASGRDTRVRLLILDALATVPGLKVYWYCFSSRTEKEIQEHFKDYRGQVIGVRYARPGLLLWELYQRLNRSLPPSGLEYPATWYIPSPPRLTEDETQKIEGTGEGGFQKQIQDANIWLQHWHGSQRERRRIGMTPVRSGLSIVTTPPASTSQFPRWRVNSLAWYLYDKWSESHSQRCIWLDAEDLRNCFELKVRLLQSVARLSGRDINKPRLWAIEEEENSPDLPQDEAHAIFQDELVNLMTGSGKKWVLFLNLRGVPGYNADPFMRLTMELEKHYTGIESPEEWLQYCRDFWKKHWTKAQRNRVAGLINRLVMDDEINTWLVVVVLHNAEDRFLFQSFEQMPPMVPIAKEEGSLSLQVTKAMEWMRSGSVPEKRQKARLLRTLTLLQQVQHRSAFVSSSVLGLNPGGEPLEVAWQRINGYLDRLINLRVVRTKPGGFLWMHWHIREYLRHQLIRDALGKEVQLKRNDLHFGLADWYSEFFGATGDPLAIFQAVYHHCRGAQLCLAHSRDGSLSKKKRDEEAVRGRGALCQVANYLETARASVVSRGHPLDTRKCLDGYIAILKEMVRSELKIRNRRKTPNLDRERSERNLRFLTMIKVRAQLYRIWFYRDIGESNQVLKECENLKTWFTRWKKDDVALWKPYVDHWPDQARWAEHWLAWEEAVASVSLRCYDDAHQRLAALAGDKMEFNMAKFVRCKIGTSVRAFVNLWNHRIGELPAQGSLASRVGPEIKSARQFLSRFDSRRMMVYVLRRLMELCLLRAEVEVVERRGKWRARRDTFLHFGLRYYQAAQILPRYVMEDEYSQLSIEQSRLHSVMAGILAKKGDHAGVHRHLNRGRGLLASLPESEEPIAQAVVDLREIYCLFTRFEELTFLQNYRQKKLRSLRAKLRKRDFEELNKQCLKAQAWLDDIRGKIEQVEHRLRHQRKSLWWWQTLCRYQMLHLEYSQLLRLLGRGLPEVALRHGAGRGTRDAELAIQIMKDMCRRVTFDAYQLARVAESFLRFSKLRGVLDPRILDWLASCIKQTASRWNSLITQQPMDILRYIMRVEHELRQHAKRTAPDGQSAVSTGRLRAGRRRSRGTSKIKPITKLKPPSHPLKGAKVLSKGSQPHRTSKSI